MLHAHRCVPREELLCQVWGDCIVVDRGQLDVAICRLRQRIEENPAQPRYVVTVARVGYQLLAPESTPVE
jgi:DNA-binding response OmpR family regulator